MALLKTKVSRPEFDEVIALIEQATSIVVCAHTSPDGDAIGSGLALSSIIQRRWPEKAITNLLADADGEVPRIYQFLEGADSFVPANKYVGTPDLFICVDLSSAGRLADAEPLMHRSKMVAVLDHHPYNDVYWNAGLVRPDAAATGVIITEFACHLGATLTPAEAQNLMCALVTDTGRFQYQNADGEAFEVAGLLVESGASPSQIALHVYQSDRLAYLHLAAKVMGRIRTFGEGRVAYSYVTTADLAASNVPLSEMDGLVDIVRCVDGTEIALFLKEVDGGKVRGNLRSKSELDISGVACQMGGGGHTAAAGFTAEGTIDDVFTEVASMLIDLLALDKES